MNNPILNNNVQASGTGTMAPWPQNSPASFLPQPPFMPPNVVGNMQNAWAPPPPPVVPQSSPHESESFPYNPNKQMFSWRQYNNNMHNTASNPSPYDCESFPYNSNNRFPWKQHQKRSQPSLNYEDNEYFPYNKKSRIKDEHFIDYCDVCDRGFKTEEKKRQHYSEHTKVIAVKEVLQLSSMYYFIS